MAISQAELDSFHQFVSERLNTATDSLTLEACLRLWREEQAYAEAVHSVRRGLADVAAGRVQSLAEFDSEMRATLGMTK